MIYTKEKNPTTGVIKYTIPNPHPPEIDAFKRGPLHFYVSLPQDGLNSETIPLLALHGHGELGQSEYLSSLHQSVTSRKNVLIFTVDYLGTKLIRGKMGLGLDGWCFEKILENLKAKNLPLPPSEAIFQGNPSENLLRYLKTLPEQANTAKNPLLVLKARVPDEHYDFGLIQVLDCLWAIQALKNDFPDIAWKYLSAAGSSHGGCLADLCAKWAPNTFSLIIDSYGWVKPYLPWMIKELNPLHDKRLGFYCDVFVENYWSLDPSSPYFFSPARSLVRTLNDADQIRQWRAQQKEKNHFVFTQQVNDSKHPEREKDAFVQKMAQAGFSHEYLKKNPAPDGKTYLSLDQKDKTSFKGLIFDFLTPNRYLNNPIQRSDFEEKSKISYDCNGTIYSIDFSGVPALSVTKASL